jgi:hypothetical protein
VCVCVCARVMLSKLCLFRDEKTGEDGFRCHVGMPIWAMKKNIERTKILES